MLRKMLNHPTESRTPHYELHVSDLGNSHPNADSGHASPLGSRAPSDLRERLTADRQTVECSPRMTSKRQKMNNTRCGIDFQRSKPWDSSSERDVWKNKVSDCPRVTMCIALESYDIDWIKADSDHLYICHVSWRCFLCRIRLTTGLGYDDRLVLTCCAELFCTVRWLWYITI